jgi:hypothetical protein
VRSRRAQYKDDALAGLAADITARLQELVGHRKNVVVYSLGGRDFRKFENPVAFLHPIKPLVVMAYHGRDAGGYCLDRARAEAYLKRLVKGFTGRHDE